MATYIMSYIAANVDKDISDSSAVWLSALGLGCQGIAMPIGGLIGRKFGPRSTMIATLILGSGGILLSYIAVQKTFIGVVFTVGIMFGLSMGVGYSVAIACAVSWFPSRRGLIVGIIVGGFGLGSLVFTPIQTAYINPTNLKVDNQTRRFTDPELLDRVPKVFLVMGSILAVLQLVACILVRMKPAPVKENENDERSEHLKIRTSLTTDLKKDKLVAGNSKCILTSFQVQFDFVYCFSVSQPLDDDEAEGNVRPGRLLRHIDYYLLFIMMLLNCFPISVLTSSLKIFGQTYITDDRFLSTITAVTSLFNSGGRVVWGAVVDRYSFKIPICIQLTTWGLLLFTFPLIAYTSGVSLKILFVIWSCALFFFMSGVFSMMPSATGTIFGPVNLAVNYGLVYLGFAFGSVLSLLVSLFWKASPELFFTFSACVCLVTLGLAIWLDDRNLPRRLRFMNWFSNHCLSSRVYRPLTVSTGED
ncbi:Oxalate:formate antiporter [Schistosoma japonicum]|nr:Oxalate:formate antiporter [Schistosoma japonicum]